MTSKNNSPKYSLEFKQDAAKLVIEKGYSHQQAAERLGVSLSALRRWVRAEKGLPSATNTRGEHLNLSERDELIKLRKEKANLLMEREIIKKAAVFFAKESR